MCRARKLGVSTPVPYHVDLKHNLVYLSRIEGCTLWQRLSNAQEGDTGAAPGSMWSSQHCVSRGTCSTTEAVKQTCCL